MRMMYERCCGLDVHKKTVTACAITPAGQEVRAFGTMTRDLLQLTDWLHSHGVSHVAMESTGVFWKPVYNLLEGAFTVLVVNARNMKALPGRKTDVKDAEWIADLLQHGLLTASFIPDRPQRELRELVRHRTTLVQERVRVVNRVQKVLEGANIKLASVVTDITGVSGQAILQAIANGMEDPAVLAALARGRLRNKRDALEQAVHGQVGAHQRLLLKSHLRHLGFLDDEIEGLDEEVAERMRPFADQLERIDEVPCIGPRTAEIVIAEAGVDMSPFPSSGHFSSWTALCPGNNESAGKRKSERRRKGNRWLTSALVEAAQSAVRVKDTYFHALYLRIAARRGHKRAIVAVAHSLLEVIYHLLKDGTRYQDLGANYFDERDRQQTVRRSVHRLERLGYHVSLEAA